MVLFCFVLIDGNVVEWAGVPCVVTVIASSNVAIATLFCALEKTFVPT